MDVLVTVKNVNKPGATLFYPFTTTFVELRLNRDPMPFGLIKNKICSLLPD